MSGTERPEDPRIAYAREFLAAYDNPPEKGTPEHDAHWSYMEIARRSGAARNHIASLLRVIDEQAEQLAAARFALTVPDDQLRPSMADIEEFFATLHEGRDAR